MKQNKCFTQTKYDVQHGCPRGRHSLTPGLSEPSLHATALDRGAVSNHLAARAVCINLCPDLFNLYNA